MIVPRAWLSWFSEKIFASGRWGGVRKKRRDNKKWKFLKNSQWGLENDVDFRFGWPIFGGELLVSGRVLEKRVG